MLQVTDRAATVLKETRSRQGFPDNFGLRVAPPVSTTKRGIQLEFSEEPVKGDEVGEMNGLRLFVAPEVAAPLAEQAIDTQDSPSGTNLVLRDQGDIHE